MPQSLLQSPAVAHVAAPVWRRAALRRAAWAWPMVLALAFAASVALWLQWSDAGDEVDERTTLINDALTLESRIGHWLADEQGRVNRLAAALPAEMDDTTLLSQPDVAAGLQRLWISVIVLDAGNRITAQVPAHASRDSPSLAQSGLDQNGVSLHLSAPVPAGGRLVLRFSPASLLRQTVPWWLARKYEVRLVDGLGQLIAASDERRPAGARASHRVSVEPELNDTWLELTLREDRVPWWRTLPLLLMVVFLLLSAAATWTLRRQVREVLRAEAQWRTEAAWRRAIEDSLTVGLRGRDPQGRLMHVNRAFCDLVGYGPAQLLGRLPPMPYWPPDSIEDSMQRHVRNMAGGAPLEGYETRWLRADGTPIDVMIYEAPLVDAQGAPAGWMGSVLDITSRKAAEARERHQLEVLATQARLTTLGEVASALAHQLNQPLTAIAGYNGGVLRSLQRDGYADTTVIDAVQRLGEQAAEAGRIVQRIRNFVTRRAPQRERCDVAEVVQGALGLVRPDLRRQGVRIELAVDAGLPTVFADPVLIQQVLINLLRNAADELLATGTAAPWVRVGASAVDERFVRIDVDDNGPGLQGRGIEQLSAPFFSTKPNGMGMGLAICRSVVEAHYGALVAGCSPLPESAGGARLSFTLPCEGGGEDC